MADYNIKFSYKGMGKAASNTRKKVIQSQKQAEKKGGTSGKQGDKATVTSIKALNTSINKLIASNKELSTALKKRPPSASGGGGGGGAGSSGGIGKVGASIPLAGALVAYTGFAIQKINQVGNAYMSLVSQQKQTVGVTGKYHQGQGAYLSGEMGQGMKSYAMKSGKFGGKVNKDALDVGGIFGLGASEVLGQAGTFSRSGEKGANYGKSADLAMGAGIQTEVPTLLAGMASLMEEAIKNGINTSDMSKDLGKEITALTMKTDSKSVDAALNIVKGFASTQKSVGEGKLGGLAGVYTARAGRSMLMEKITGKGGGDYLDKLLKEQNIDETGYTALKEVRKLGDKATFKDVVNATDGNTAFGLEERVVRKAGPAKMAIAGMRQAIKDRGGKGSATDMYNIQRYMPGWGNQENTQALYKVARNPDLDEKDLIGKGYIERKKRIQGVQGGISGQGVAKGIRGENMTLDYGKPFAELSISFEKAMIDMVRVGSDGLVVALQGIKTAAENVSGALDAVEKGYSKTKKVAGELYDTAVGWFK